MFVEGGCDQGRDVVKFINLQIYSSVIRYYESLVGQATNKGVSGHAI